MRVILAEKPDMGRKIAEALGNGRESKGYITLENGDIVTWAIGHIVRLKTPDKYPELAEWKYETLPVIPNPMQLEIDPEKQAQFTIIKNLVNSCKEVVISTDPGREGELIARWILKMAGYKGHLKRLWIDDLTKPTIQAGFNNLLDGKETVNLGAAAEVRAKADYIIGFTASRFFTLVATEGTREKTVLNSGRVQSPTLKIVYDREVAIETFKSEPFFELLCKFNTEQGAYVGKWFRKEGEGIHPRFKTKAEADKLHEKIKDGNGTVTIYEEKEVTRKAPQLLHATSLKTEARKRYGLGIDETAKIAQALYDKGLITYTRTASRHLSENAADKLALDLIKLKDRSKYGALFPQSIESLKGNTRFVDNKKATEHHAIVPTGQIPSGLSAKEEQLYELILRQTLAAHYLPGKDKEIVIVTTVKGETFYSRGISVLTEGWRKILNQDKEDEGTEEIGNVPVLSQGMAARIAESGVHKGNTTPPKRLTEDQLEKAMENAGKILDEEMEDKEAYHLLKEKGLGTVATRTAIIKNLMATGYIDSKKNLIYLTSKGRNFIELISHHAITSIELTGDFESQLKAVEDGKVDAQSVLQNFIDFSFSITKEKETLLARIQEQAKGKPLFQKDVEAVSECPKCHKTVIEREKFYGCSGYKDGCDFTLPKKFLTAKFGKREVKALCEGKKIMLKLQGEYGPFDLIIYLNAEGKIEKQKPTLEERGIGNCPLCKKPVLEREKFYGCTGYKDGCGFSLPKVMKGKTITAAQAKKIIEKGSSDLIKGFTGTKGPFDAYLVFNKEENKLTFKFPVKPKESLNFTFKK